MTIHTQRPPTSGQYVLEVARGIRIANMFLSGTDVEFASVGAIGYLFDTLEKMKYGDPLKSYGGVWKKIDEVLLKYQGIVPSDTKEQRAEWFQGVLKRMNRYIELKELIDKLECGLRGIDLRLSVGDASEAVSLILDPEITGGNAYKLAQQVVAELDDVVTKYVVECSAEIAASKSGI